MSCAGTPARSSSDPSESDNCSAMPTRAVADVGAAAVWPDGGVADTGVACGTTITRLGHDSDVVPARSMISR